MREREISYTSNINWIVISLIVVAVCTLLVLYMPGIRDFDWAVLKSVQKFLAPYPSYIPWFFSEFGRGYHLFWPQFAACCALVSNQKYIKAFLLVFFTQVSWYLNTFIKELICRERPCGDECVGFSFPSGHTTTTMCLLGICIYLILHYTRNRFWRYFLATFLGLYIFMVGLSRIWLNHHFPIDVIAGMFLGLLLVNLYIITCKFFDR